MKGDSVVDKRRVRNILLGGILTLGLSVTIKEEDNQDEVKKLLASIRRSGSRDLSVAKKEYKTNRDFDLANFPEKIADENKEEFDGGAASVEEDWEEYQKKVNKYDVYDEQAVWAIKKMFPRTKIKLSNEDIFEQIQIGDYYLERNLGAEESYTLTKWVKNDLEYNPDDSQYHVTQDLIEFVKEPDGSFTLRTSSGDWHTSYSDKETFAGALQEYVTLREALYDSQRIKYQKSGSDYVESVKLYDYYEERLRQLMIMKKQKWYFIPMGKEFDDIIDDAISETESHMVMIRLDIEKTQP